LGSLLILLPAAGFVVAAGIGIVMRTRSARKDEQLRDLRFVE
jgi:hypothetical protein